MNIVENNKLIAEFMSIPVINETSGIITPMYKAVGLGGWCREDELKYNLRWDWLMSVVEKIESLDLELLKRNIKYNLDKGINFQNSNSIIIRWDKNNKRVFISSDRNRAYKAVVEFIKWYNKQGGKDED